MKKPQILATIGPASVNRIREMYLAGMNGIRINSSHADIRQHARILRNARGASRKIFTVYDIKGPKIRIGDLERPVHLRAGMEITLFTGRKPAEKARDAGDGVMIRVMYDRFHRYVRRGHRLILDDGLIGLTVRKVSGRSILCRVLYGDILRSRKGVNHPDTVIPFPYTVEEDLPALDFAIRNRVDYIADSFVRNADDVEELRQRLNGTGIRIISKIENPEGVRNFDQILRKTDAVMIARGDLGVELDPWDIPEIQKRFIEKCNRAAKPVITATQMLESMIDDPMPNRADVSDIANAIYDGTDAVMLSAETSVGRYPVECVKMMSRVIQKTWSTPRYRSVKRRVRGLA